MKGKWIFPINSTIISCRQASILSFSRFSCNSMKLIKRFSWINFMSESKSKGKPKIFLKSWNTAIKSCSRVDWIFSYLLYFLIFYISSRFCHYFCFDKSRKNMKALDHHMNKNEAIFEGNSLPFTQNALSFLAHLDFRPRLYFLSGGMTGPL